MYKSPFKNSNVRKRASVSALQAQPMFGSVPVEALRGVADRSVERAYKRDTVLSCSEDATHSVFVVASGLVGVGRISERGEEFLPVTLAPGDHLALQLLGRYCREPLYAVALTRFVDSLELPATQLGELRRSYPVVQEAIECQVLEQWSCLLAFLSDFAFCDAQTRFTHTLGRLASRLAQEDISLTHEQLARVSGLSRVQVTEYLGKLRTLGLIQSHAHGRGISIPRPSLLTSFDDTKIVANETVVMSR